MHNISPPDISHTLAGLAHYLVQDELLDIKSTQIAVQHAAEQGISLTYYLVKLGLLSSQAILTCCANHFDLPIDDLREYDITRLHESAFKALFYRYRVLPLKEDQTYLYLGVTDPTDHLSLSAIAFHTGLRIRTILVAEADMQRIMMSLHETDELASRLELALAKVHLQDTSPLNETQETQSEEDEPISNFADQLIQKAIEKQASDIHIEPYQHYCRIRFRCDGILSETTSIPPELATRLTMRLKIMAGLNIAERRQPQDGHIRWHKSSSLDIRINTCPTLFGEKIVLRLLDKTHINLDIHYLGFTEKQKTLFLDKLAQPQGMILVTGPTGSGKTVTLYSALHYLNQIEKNISSVEDPVEIELNGINQVTINPKIGLDFAAVLRSLLRQDPDIIMIGEIRDHITAQIAIQAAQTGHLVLSTLHTNSAAETIQRLQSLGISPCNLIHSISLIIAQRLVRKLCQYCKQPDILPANLQQLIHIAYRAHGCEHCHAGYIGRTAIFELMPMSAALAKQIASGSDISPSLLGKQRACVSLYEASLALIRDGMTSYTEIKRVLGTEES